MKVNDLTSSEFEMMDGSDTVLLSIGQLDPVSASSLGQILRMKKHNIVIDVVAASYNIILQIYTI